MKRYLVVLFFLLNALPVSAQDIASATEEKDNAFGYPNTDTIKVIQNENIKDNKTILSKPDCNDPKLLQQAKDSLIPYISSPNQTIAQKRRNSLILKSISNFTPIEADTVKPQEHRRLAGRMIELKINKHLSNDNFKICQSSSPMLKTRIYILMYDDNGGVRADIINFNEQRRPSFIVATD